MRPATKAFVGLTIGALLALVWHVRDLEMRLRSLEDQRHSHYGAHARMIDDG